MSHTKRNCDFCGKEYMADNRNLERGWGLTCSKSCAAKKREMSKPGYNPEKVATNNDRRKNWNKGAWSQEHKMRVDGFDTQGNAIIDGDVVDEYGEPLYPAHLADDDMGWDAHKGY